MLRRAFIMHLKSGCEAEYKKRHDAIWPELKTALTDAGISNYSISLHAESGTLFAYQELSDSHTADDLPQHAMVKKWWSYMADIMETNADCSPKTTPLPEVFYMK